MPSSPVGSMERPTLMSTVVLRGAWPPCREIVGWEEWEGGCFVGPLSRLDVFADYGRWDFIDVLRDYARSSGDRRSKSDAGCPGRGRRALLHRSGRLLLPAGIPFRGASRWIPMHMWPDPYQLNLQPRTRNNINIKSDIGILNTSALSLCVPLPFLLPERLHEMSDSLTEIGHGAHGYRIGLTLIDNRLDNNICALNLQ